MPPLATAFVRVRPDTAQFPREAKAGIAKAGPELAKEGGRHGRLFGTSFVKASAGPFRSIIGVVGGPLAAAFAAVASVSVFKDFIAEARDARKVGAQTAAVIKSTGGAAKITATQVGSLATAISNKVGVDDEAIQSGENLLLTFTGVRNEAGKGNRIFDQASQAIVDMTAAMNGGKVSQEGLKTSAIQVGKALQDPIKGVTALRKVGVALSESQVKQIKSLVAHGHALDAQKIILRELNKEFGGSAAASATAGQKLSVVFGNIKEQLGTLVLPVLDKFENFLAAHLPTAVNTALGYLGRVKLAFKALSDLLIRGDFTTAFRKAFHVDEDSSVVRTLLGIRTAVSDAADWISRRGVPALRQAFAGTKSIAHGVVNDVKVEWLTISPYLNEVIFPAVSTAAGKVVGAAKEEWQKVSPYLTSTIFPGIKKAVGDFVKDITKRAADLGSGIFTGLQRGVQTGDWGSLGATVGKALAEALHRALQVAIDIAGWLGEFIRKVDWVGIGLEIGKQVPSLLVGLAAGILNFDLAGLLSGVGKHWLDIVLGILAIAFAPSRLLGKVGELLGRVPLAGSMLKWAFEHLVTFSKGLVRGVGRALGFLGRAFLDGFRVVFPAVGKAFGTWLELFPTRIGLAAIAVRDAIGRLIRGLGNAIAAGAGFVARKIGELIGRLVKPFASAGSWLVDAGARVVRGLLSGLTSAWRNVAVWLGDRKASVLHFIGNAAGWLLDVGFQVITGMWDGFKRAMQRVGEILGSIKDAIVGGLKRLFGISSPSQVMMEIGGHIITGLVKGMLLGSGALARTTKAIGGTIESVFGPAANNGALLGVPSSGSGNPRYFPSAGYAAVIQMGRQAAGSLYAWTGQQFNALKTLWDNESGWNPLADNPTSTAFGIPQFLAGTARQYGVYGSTDPMAQIVAGLKYISDRYGNPERALSAWMSRSPHWYGSGGIISEPVLGIGRSGQMYGFGERGPETVVPGRPGSNTGQRATMPVEASRPIMVQLVCDGRVLAEVVASELEGAIASGARR